MDIVHRIRFSISTHHLFSELDTGRGCLSIKSKFYLSRTLDKFAMTVSLSKFREMPGIGIEHSGEDDYLSENSPLTVKFRSQIQLV